MHTCLRYKPLRVELGSCSLIHSTDIYQEYIENTVENKTSTVLCPQGSEHDNVQVNKRTTR